MKKVSSLALLSMTVFLVLAFSSCKKNKMEKSNYMEINFDGKKDKYTLENLTIAVTHYKSTDTYSFSGIGYKPKDGEEGYPGYDFSVLFSIANFTKTSQTTIEVIHNSPDYRIDVSGRDVAESFGSYISTNNIGGKKGISKVMLEVVDFDKKIIRGRVEKMELWGQGWGYAHTIKAEEIYFNFVDFTIVEEE